MTTAETVAAERQGAAAVPRERTWLSIEEAVDDSGFSRSTIERALAAYRRNKKTGLPHSRPTSRIPTSRAPVRIDRAGYDAWMRGERTGSTRQATRPPRGAQTRTAA